jgi:hypothetical protein
MRFLILSLLLPGLPLLGALKPEDPIVAPKNAAAVPIPDLLQRAAKKLGLDPSKVPAFYDDRNILELSFYGNRRGIPGPDKSGILIKKGLQRYWLADQFPDPKPTTILGPFDGNAIEDLKLLQVFQEGLKERNYGSHMQALRGLLHSEDPGLVRFALQIVPPSMSERPSEVESFLHFLKSALPARQEAFAKMGLAKETTAALKSMKLAHARIAAVTVQPPARAYQAGYDPAKEQRNGIGILPDDAWGEPKNGLQAALTTPPTLKLNERVPLYFVFRNITDDTIRVSFPGTTGNLRLRYESTPHLTYGGTEGIGGLRQALTHWSLPPGQQAMVFCRDLQIMKKGTISPKGAYENGKPDTISLWASSDSDDEWEYRRNQEPRLVAVPESGWSDTCPPGSGTCKGGEGGRVVSAGSGNGRIPERALP